MKTIKEVKKEIELWEEKNKNDLYVLDSNIHYHRARGRLETLKEVLEMIKKEFADCRNPNCMKHKEKLKSKIEGK